MARAIFPLRSLASLVCCWLLFFMTGINFLTRYRPGIMSSRNRRTKIGVFFMRFSRVTSLDDIHIETENASVTVIGRHGRILANLGHIVPQTLIRLENSLPFGQRS